MAASNESASSFVDRSFASPRRRNPLHVGTSPGQGFWPDSGRQPDVLGREPDIRSNIVGLSRDHSPGRRRQENQEEFAQARDPQAMRHDAPHHFCVTTEDRLFAGRPRWPRTRATYSWHRRTPDYSVPNPLPRHGGVAGHWCACGGACIMISMKMATAVFDRLKPHVNRDRLVDTAVRLVEVPSRTGEAGDVLDRLAEILSADGFTVERPVGAATPRRRPSPSASRADDPGRTLQFNGHLDTVHLPFVPPSVEDGLLTGSGASDMKGGHGRRGRGACGPCAMPDALHGGLDPADRARPPRGPLGRRPAARPADPRRLRRRRRAAPRAAVRPSCRSSAAARPPGRSRSAATGRRSTRSCGRSDEPSVIAAGAELVRPARPPRASGSPRAPTRSAARPASSSARSTAARSTTSIPRNAGSKGRGAGCPGRTARPVEREFRALARRARGATRGRRSTCDWHAHPRRLPPRPGRPVRRGLPGLPTGRSRAATCRSARSRSWTTATASGRSASVPAITHGPRAGGQHTVSRVGRRSTTWSGSRRSTR